MSKEFVHTLEEKLTAVRLYEKKGNITEVGRIMGVCPSLIHSWIRSFSLNGPASLIPKKSHQIYDPEMRIAIVEDIRDKEVSLREASAIFGVSTKTLSRWLKDVEDRGFTALFDRIPSTKVPGMTRMKKQKEPLTELEQLREENMRLRAELDLIKKVDALVAKRCKPIRKSVRKPSKD